MYYANLFIYIIALLIAACAPADKNTQSKPLVYSSNSQEPTINSNQTATASNSRKPTTNSNQTTTPTTKITATTGSTRGTPQEGRQASSNYEIENKNNVASIKKNGTLIKRVDYTSFPNSEYIVTLESLIKNLRESEENLATHRDPRFIDLIKQTNTQLELTIDSLVALLK